MSRNAWATGVPRLAAWDSTRALLADPYRFIARQAALRGTNAIQTRVFGRPTLCLVGGDAVALFCDDGVVSRRRAVPESLRATLLGRGGVQGLDGEAHRRRKALFLSALDAPAVGALLRHTQARWDMALADWQAAGVFSLYRALQPVFTRAACDWAGVPLPAEDLGRRTRQLCALYDHAARGFMGPVRAGLARAGAERWAAALIEATRRGRIHPPAGSALALVAQHREARGVLAPRVAAVELLNLLRPVVGVSLCVAQLAHALQANPEWRERLRGACQGLQAQRFVQEVRRCYPFCPVLAGRVCRRSWWAHRELPVGLRVLLDVHGTHHDPQYWAQPERFDPGRWSAWPDTPAPLAFIPHGGAQAASPHHCPGEDATGGLMLLALHMLVDRLSYTVPPQPRGLDLQRLPARPHGGFLIERVQERPLGH